MNLHYEGLRPHVEAAAGTTDANRVIKDPTLGKINNLLSQAYVHKARGDDAACDGTVAACKPLLEELKAVAAAGDAVYRSACSDLEIETAEPVVIASSTNTEPIELGSEPVTVALEPVEEPAEEPDKPKKSKR